MADNNDDQYLDELLNSLRSSNSDGNEDLDNQDSESNKSRQSDAEDNEAAEDGSNEEQDDFLNDIFSDSHNDVDHQNGNADHDGSDDILALEENDNEEPHESGNSMDEENVTSQNTSRTIIMITTALWIYSIRLMAAITAEAVIALEKSLIKDLIMLRTIY